VYAVKIRDLRHFRQGITDSCATFDPNMLSKHGKAAEKMRRVSGGTYSEYNVNNK
jgi:hypothetical protein